MRSKTRLVFLHSIFFTLLFDISIAAPNVMDAKVKMNGGITVDALTIQFGKKVAKSEQMVLLAIASQKSFNQLKNYKGFLKQKFSITTENFSGFLVAPYYPSNGKRLTSEIKPEFAPAFLFQFSKQKKLINPKYSFIDFSQNSLSALDFASIAPNFYRSYIVFLDKFFQKSKPVTRSSLAALEKPNFRKLSSKTFVNFILLDKYKGKFKNQLTSLSANLNLNRVSHRLLEVNSSFPAIQSNQQFKSPKIDWKTVFFGKDSGGYATSNIQQATNNDTRAQDTIDRQEKEETTISTKPKAGTTSLGVGDIGDAILKLENSH